MTMTRLQSVQHSFYSTFMQMPKLCNVKIRRKFYYSLGVFKNRNLQTESYKMYHNHKKFSLINLYLQYSLFMNVFKHIYTSCIIYGTAAWWIVKKQQRKLTEPLALLKLMLSGRILKDQQTGDHQALSRALPIRVYFTVTMTICLDILFMYYTGFAFGKTLNHLRSFSFLSPV